MKLILEGPNNVGKSTLAKELSKHLNWPIKHFGAEFGNTFTDWYNELNNETNEIWDRSFICERVYPYVDKRDARLSEQECYKLLNLFYKDIIIIYIDTSTKFIIDGYNSKNEYFTFNYLDQERMYYEDLLHNILWYIPNLRYTYLFNEGATVYYAQGIIKKYKLKINEEQVLFSKGYAEDAGMDILLDRDVIFKAGEITVVDLNIKFTPNTNTMAYLIARTSAAKQGLLVQSCPIDTNYTGNINAIVYNFSKEDITYKKGEAFCQLVYIPIIQINVPARKRGKRSDGNFGSTNK